MLIYSPLFGLRVLCGYPPKLYQGMYCRGLDPNNSWSKTILRKNTFGRNVVVEWVQVEKTALPAKLKLEALLLGLTL